MKLNAKLILIPASLGSKSTSHILPMHNREMIKDISIFIVENIRSARRFLRASGFQKDFNEVTFHVLDKHTELTELQSFLAKREEQTIGLLSEAGLPCIADPGAQIVRMAHEKNMEVVPLVGPSSIMLSLMASGFNGQNFVFHGYLPIQKKEREMKILEIERSVYQHDQTQIFIETPYRNMQMLESLQEKCRKDTHLCLAWNLTLPGQQIISQDIAAWQKMKIDIHKKPAVFLLYK